MTLIASLEWVPLGVFWVSLFAAMFAASAVYINYLFFRSQINPHVIVYATPDKRRPSLILLVIKNIGKGLAKDVRFEFSAPIPEYALGINDAKMPERMTSGPLITGIPALGPGAERVITWGQYGGLYKFLGNNVINVRVTFKSDAIGPFDKEEHFVDCPLDIKSFEATDSSDSNWDQKAVKQLERIADALSKNR